MSCHPDKAIEKILARNLRKTKNFSQRAANLNLKNITNTKDTYTTEECLNCHPGRLDVMQREDYLLPSENLEKLGLILNKKMHQRYELFNDEDAVLYDELRNKTVRSEDAEKELLLLEKIRFGNCGQCHIQKKEQSLDKGVNYIARNPVSCAGCHEEATTLSHPGKMMKFPTKEACQKCHHGKIHGKFQIFKADCDEQIETEHCVKCHPYYDKKKFSAIARK